MNIISGGSLLEKKSGGNLQKNIISITFFFLSKKRKIYFLHSKINITFAKIIYPKNYYKFNFCDFNCLFFNCIS